MMSAEANSERSLSYQKKDERGHARPSFFWYDNDKDLKVCLLVTRVLSFQWELLQNNTTIQSNIHILNSKIIVKILVYS